MSTKALVLVAHGSRRDASNEEVKALGEALKAVQKEHYEVVETSFLEFASPSLEQSLKALISQNIGHIVILPYFLASGNHVTKDIPHIITSIQTSYPKVTITLKEHLGSNPAMVSLLSQIADE